MSLNTRLARLESRVPTTPKIIRILTIFVDVTTQPVIGYRADDGLELYKQDDENLEQLKDRFYQDDWQGVRYLSAIY